MGCLKLDILEKSLPSLKVVHRNYELEEKVSVGSNVYLYNGKEKIGEAIRLNWLSYGFRMYDPAIGRFPSVDPLADQFAWMSGYNYAENSPIGNIDLWGLQKYWAADGAFIKQVGKDKTMRVVTDDSFNVNSSADDLMANSSQIYKSTDKNEQMILGKWASKNRNTQKEHAMSIFTKYIENEHGIGYFSVIMEGSTEISLDRRSVYLEGSTGLDGWYRSTTIHTHPGNDNPRDLSNLAPGFAQPSDIGLAIELNIKIAMVPSGDYSPFGASSDIARGYYYGIFDPIEYRNISSSYNSDFWDTDWTNKSLIRKATNIVKYGKY